MNTKLKRVVMAGLLLVTSAGCSTAYDAYGRPRTVVDPGVAVLGAAAAGLAGYAIAKNRDDGHRHHRRHGHRSHYYH